MLRGFKIFIFILIMKNTFKTLFFIFFPLYFYAQTAAKVIGIKDGDTILVLDDYNNQITLRLAEVDCPESGQPFGKNAKQYTSSLVFGKRIKFYKTNTDRYRRIIAKIYYDNGKYLSEEIIKAGLGWWYFRYSENKNLGVLESNAKKMKIGLWSDNNALAPWEYRKLKY
jgi:micrococcal nuclease